jgi:hypothetical protein
MTKEHQLVNDIRSPFYAISELLSVSEEAKIATVDPCSIAVLLKMALTRAEN